MRILGIDPGYERIGIAVIERLPVRPGQKQTDALLFSECFITSAKLPFPARLRAIGEELSRVIEEFEPSKMAIEKLFFTKNQTTGMGVAEARGVIIYEAAKRGMEVREYTPPEIKVAVTGSGRADKKQIISMIPRLIRIEKEIQYDDEYDAIAAGITCLASHLASKTIL